MRHAVTFSWWLALTMFILAPAPVTVSSAYGLGSVAYADGHDGEEGPDYGVPAECVDEYFVFIMAEIQYQIVLATSSSTVFGVPDLTQIQAAKESMDEALDELLYCINTYGDDD